MQATHEIADRSTLRRVDDAGVVAPPRSDAQKVPVLRHDHSVFRPGKVEQVFVVGTEQPGLRYRNESPRRVALDPP